MTIPQPGAVTELGRGIVALTPRGDGVRVPSDRLRTDWIEEGRADAVVYTPGPDGRELLLAPTGTILLRASSLVRLDAELVSDVEGRGRFQDPETALLDVQWQLRIGGDRVVTADGPMPARWDATSPEERIGRIRGLLTMLQADLTQPLRGQILTLAELVATSSSLRTAGADTTVLDLQRSPGGDDVGSVDVPAASLVGAFAIDRALDDLAPSATRRKHIDENRRVPDRAILGLIREALPLILGQMGASPAEIAPLASLLGLDEDLARRMRVLVLAPAEGAAADRASALAARLEGRAHVRRTCVESEETTEAGRLVPGWIHDHVRWADVLVLVSASLDDAPGARFSTAPLIADLATRDVAGWLMNGPRTRYRAGALRDLMTRADLVIAADDVQRDILLGALAGTERINADVYDDDPSLASLVATDPDLDRETDFCLHPVRAADLAHEIPEPTPPRPRDLQLIRTYFREGGVQEVATRAMGRIRRTLPVRSTNEGN